jgi:anthranilate/para-aminobenzoate synthase component I
MWADRTPPERLAELIAILRPLATGAPVAPIFLESGPSGPTTFTQPLTTISYSAGRARIGGTEIRAQAFEILEAALLAWKNIEGAILAGYLAYDLAAEIEDLGDYPPDDSGLPSLYMGLYTKPSGFEAPAGGFAAGLTSSQPDQAEFEAGVGRIVRSIYAGDIFQTNLCRRIETLVLPGTAWGIYQRLAAESPARYAAFIQVSDDQAVMSISPESFLSVRDRRVESSPIKGTRPRGRNEAEDAALIADLCSSEKDLAELAMIVDVVRNDLGRVCRAGSVRVAKHAELMTIPTVHHLYSTVEGTLREDVSPVDLLRAAFPAASISGAPKIEAMRIALREEKQVRGPAMGAIGWIDMQGNMDFSVAIRTATMSGRTVRYYAGCGITADSDPAAEFAERAHKATAFLRALGITKPVANE